ncbi:hypothetical protein [Pontibacter actiniarum]|uniref:Uncharacterized protein n=1 Tax=Pontibacter actiniarum TaxID=323450 RepID=A0A1X9YWG9_9BACT|nr:hypothetical protein [Pontibacter actiniarum]ARS37094.1 hypothetical protein CA264_17565 [Pontibacter actiniarum]
MTLKLHNSWKAVSHVLTVVNLVLLMVLTGQGFNYREARGKKVPFAANMLLLLVLCVAVAATVYGVM